MKAIAVSLLSVTLIAGCTNLESKKILGNDNTPSGLTYRLPAKKFAVKAMLEITGCQVQGNRALVDATIGAALSESLVGGEAYTIDYQKLNAWTKVTNTEFQISEAGLLVGINASITDQSGAVMANTASAVASVARAAAITPLSATLTPQFRTAIREVDGLKIQQGRTVNLSDTQQMQIMLPDTFSEFKHFDINRISGKDVAGLRQAKEEAKISCGEVTEAITEKRESEVKLKEEKRKDKDRESLQKKISQFETEITSLRSLVDFYEKLGDSVEKQSLLNKVRIAEKDKQKSVSDLKTLGPSEVEALSKSIARATDKLTISASRDFVPVDSRAVCMDDQGSPRKFCEIQINQEGIDKAFGKAIDRSTLVLPVVTFTVNQIAGISELEKREPKSDGLGIAYRIPVPATAYVSYRNKPTDTVSYPLIEQTTQVPQFGPVGSINLDNIMFDDNLVEVAFNPATGSPSKLAFKAKSKAESASAATRDAASTYLQLQKDKRNDQVEANKLTQEYFASQIALEKSLSDLDLSKTQSSASAAKVQADLQQSLLSSKIQLLRDQQRLDAVRTGTATSAEVELEALNTQEQLLAQRLKILRLEQEIAAQKAKIISD
ncbi:hypothetical protein HNQ27_21465 [Pseudomonas sp. B11D7D]|nr:hypothetical protein [Pseudomonas sp. B11D7D]QNH05213.1 hypothetical protein HNQ27_21465 [Pseudomonas sp. B11D7D]